MVTSPPIAWRLLIVLGAMFGLGVAAWHWMGAIGDSEPGSSDTIGAVPEGAVPPLAPFPERGSAASASPSENSETLWPLEGGRARVTKKPFGIRIDLATSPVRPERFRGYHTGADFEVFSGEDPTTLTVRAVCTGELAAVRWVSGYGGVAVQSCVYGGEPVTVVYGHLALDSIALRTGEILGRGDTIGTLGRNRSRDTDGERAHLHLAFHRGRDIDLRGYVTRSAALAAWLDPLTVVGGAGGLE